MGKEIEALRQSIKKWENIVYHNAIDGHASDCKLCQLFMIIDKNTCPDCPIMKKTGKHRCKGSPYENWINYLEEKQSDEYKIIDDHSRELAIDELFFLIDLLMERQDAKRENNR